MKKVPVLISGAAPSGRLTLGNYLGAIRHWVAEQDRHRCFFPLVDLHAITVRQDPVTFAARCRDFVALYLACGVDPERSVVFVQSHVAQHSQLAWIFQCYTQFGELNRMTQFKEKGRDKSGQTCAGLFGYPVLMAADIALYKAERVPVGDDQMQHLELTRDVITRFNGLYGSIFPMPEPIVGAAGARIMSLQDPSKKMSKSDPVDANVIALLDEPDVVSQKIRRCVTDSGGEVLARADKPGVSNLLSILSALTTESVPELESRFAGKGYGALKREVTEVIIAVLAPIQARFQEIRSDEVALDAVLQHGAIEARGTAAQTLREVHCALGFIPAAPQPDPGGLSLHQ